MKEDVIAKKRTVLRNLEPTRAPTAMEDSRNSKRDPRRLYKMPKNMVEGSNWSRRTTFLESGPDGHVNPLMDIEIIVIGNSYLATSRL
jgi:hypothetical protein